jgi:hypothetical protein
MNSTLNKEELPEQGKESINIRRYKKGDETGFSTYKGKAHLLNPYNQSVQHSAVKANSICRESIWYHQCGFRRNSSIPDHTFCVPRILVEKWGYNEAVH